MLKISTVKCLKTLNIKNRGVNMEINGLSQGRQISIENSIGASSENVRVMDNKVTDINNENVNASKEIDPKDVKKAVDKLNKFLEGEGSHAEYSFHDKLKYDIMIKIVDDKTGQVIQELPPKKILDMIAKMCEMVGVIFDKKA